MATKEELIKELSIANGIVGYQLIDTGNEFEDDNHSLICDSKYKVTVQDLKTNTFRTQTVTMRVTKLRSLDGTEQVEGDPIAKIKYKITGEIALWDRRPGISDYDKVDSLVIDHLMARPEKPFAAIERFSDTSTGIVIAKVFYSKEDPNFAHTHDVIAWSKRPGHLESKILSKEFALGE